MAARLAAAEGLTAEEVELAELAALLHESMDHKYRWRRVDGCRELIRWPPGRGKAGHRGCLPTPPPPPCPPRSEDVAADRRRLEAFLEGELGLAADERGVVLATIEGMGFKEELGRRQQAQQAGEQAREPRPQQGPRQPRVRRDRVQAAVQDADRLDAIGAIGVARCLTYGGRRGRVLHDPAVPPRQALSRHEYADQAAAARQTTLNHFYEKLFLLKVRILSMRLVCGSWRARRACRCSADPGTDPGPNTTPPPAHAGPDAH